MKDQKPPEEKFICEECGTVVPTAEAFCPNCGAPMENYSDNHIALEEDSEDDLDLSQEALEKGLEEDDDSVPMSLEQLREDEAEDDDYNNLTENNSQ